MASSWAQMMASKMESSWDQMIALSLMSKMSSSWAPMTARSSYDYDIMLPKDGIKLGINNVMQLGQDNSTKLGINNVKELD
eukprot:1011618-Ditylum_brightwellii.AAC.1